MMILYGIISVSIIVLSVLSHVVISSERSKVLNSASEGGNEKPYWIYPQHMVNHTQAEHVDTDLQLHCMAGGNPKPQISWYKNGVEINKITRPSNLRPIGVFQNVTSVNMSSSVLYIERLIRFDEGVYSCMASNSMGNLTHKYPIDILQNLIHEPILVKTSQNQTAMVGMEVTMFCKFKSDLNFAVTWHRSAESVEINEIDGQNDSHFRVLHDMYGKQLYGDKLYLPSVRKSDTGMYYCIGETNYDSSEPGFLHLTVLDEKDSIVEGPGNVTAVSGQTVVFECKVAPDLREYIVWLYISNESDDTGVVEGNKTERDISSDMYVDDMMEINEVGNYQYNDYLTIFDGNKVVFGEKKEIIKLENITKDDIGEYACGIAKDKTLLHFKSAHLTVVDSLLQYYELDQSITSMVLPNVQAAASDEWHNHQTLLITSISFIIFIFTTLALTFYGWRRLKYAQSRKNDIEANAAYSMQQWTKKVIIEKQETKDNMECRSATSTICAPIIRIEKQSCLVSRNYSAATNNATTSSVGGLSNSNNSEMRSRLGSENTTLTTLSEYDLPLDPNWEFNRMHLKLGESLGEGAFGKVVKGRAFNIDGNGTFKSVGVKMLKEGHTDREMIDLVSEMQMMKMIIGTSDWQRSSNNSSVANSQPQQEDRMLNIVRLLGVCTQDGPLYVIVEFAKYGNLRDFLRQFDDGRKRKYQNMGPNRLASQTLNESGSNNNDDDGDVLKTSDGKVENEDDIFDKEVECLSIRQLMSFARQVSKGMEFLSAKKCIHRDLAARNVLVADKWIVKIADFGLARDIHSNDYYRKQGDGRLPVKWMAPETLFQRRYTVESDVWSYGILMWEIMNLGANPYPSVPSVEKLFHLLRQGHRMECPMNCPPSMYQVMRACWHGDPKRRPSFVQLTEAIDKFMAHEAAQDYLDMNSVSDWDSSPTIPYPPSEPTTPFFAATDNNLQHPPRSDMIQKNTVMPPMAYQNLKFSDEAECLKQESEFLQKTIEQIEMTCAVGHSSDKRGQINTHDNNNPCDMTLKAKHHRLEFSGGHTTLSNIDEMNEPPPMDKLDISSDDSIDDKSSHSFSCSSKPTSPSSSPCSSSSSSGGGESTKSSPLNHSFGARNGLISTPLNLFVSNLQYDCTNTEGSSSSNIHDTETLKPPPMIDCNVKQELLPKTVVTTTL